MGIVMKQNLLKKQRRKISYYFEQQLSKTNISITDNHR